MTSIVRLFLVSIVFLASILSVSPSPLAAAEGELRWGLHVTLAARWLDPAETEAFNTPYMVMYAVHDALVRSPRRGHDVAPPGRVASAGVWARGWP
jgi:hypothetical protein